MGKWYGFRFLPLVIFLSITGCGDDAHQVQNGSTSEASFNSTNNDLSGATDALAQCEATYKIQIAECANIKSDVLVIQNRQQKECQIKADLWLEKKTRDLKRSEALIKSQFLYCMQNLKPKFQNTSELSGTCKEVVQPLIDDLKTICEL